jgi:branched-chain amino acid transport system permease protein
MESFIQILVGGITVGSFYALVALGYTMVYGIIRLINFSHGDLVMVAAFVGWFVLQQDFLEGFPQVIQVLIALAITVAVTCAISLLLLKFIYRPLIPFPLGFMIVALSVAFMLQEVVKLIFGGRDKAYPSFAISEESINVLGVTLNRMDLVIIALAAVLMVAMLFFTHKTMTGTAMRALAVDHDAARLMGINVTMLIAVAFAVGAALAAFTGVFSGVYYQRIGFGMGFLLGMKAFTAAVVGGIGNVGGAMVGGLLIGILEAMIQGYLSGTWSDAFIFGTLILVLYLRPRGLLGERVAQST